jgi:hypothetical protein
MDARKISGMASSVRYSMTRSSRFRHVCLGVTIAFEEEPVPVKANPRGR